MLEQASIELTAEFGWVCGAVFRYDVVGRLRRCCDDRGVTFLAFGFAPDGLRLVFDGEPGEVREVLRGVKVGTVRAGVRWGLAFQPRATRRQVGERLEDAVVWAHTAPSGAGRIDPLASPWSSHRDLMGFRCARFFDAGPLRARVDPAVVHAGCGGRWPPPPPVPAALPDLAALLRVAGAVWGVLPSDRRCFRSFVHVGRRLGHATEALARALALTTRRVRQLLAEPDPLADLVERCARDPVLSRVP